MMVANFKNLFVLFRLLRLFSDFVVFSSRMLQ